MSETLRQLSKLIDRLRESQAHPQDVWDLACRLRHDALRRTGQASGMMPVRSRVPGLPVKSEGPTQGERGADGLSTDATRNPDLTYGGA